MGIRFYCPNGHKLHVKDFQAGKRGVCPHCGAKIQIPYQSTRKSSRDERIEAEIGISLDPEPAAPSEQDLIRYTPETSDSGFGDQFHGDTGSPYVSNPFLTTPAPVRRPETSAETAKAAVPPGPTPEFRPTAAAPAGFPTSPAAPTTGLPRPEPGLGGIPMGFGSSPAVGSAPSVGSAGAVMSAAGADPLAAGNAGMWYVRPAAGGQYGPAAGEVMRVWLSEGRVGADSLVWCEGWPDWKMGFEVFPQLRAGMAATGGVAVGAADAGLAADVASARARRRRPSIRTQVAIIVVLTIAVLVLVGVFLFVLIQPFNSAWSSPTEAPGVAWSAKTAAGMSGLVR
ncbi:MAG: GYF domain-containing protein [Planctomycetota bacterium]